MFEPTLVYHFPSSSGKIHFWKKSFANSMLVSRKSSFQEIFKTIKLSSFHTTKSPYCTSCRHICKCIWYSIGLSSLQFEVAMAGGLKAKADSKKDLSLQENGHFTSITPDLQQLHVMKPSGVAPIKRYFGSTTNPLSDATRSMYSSWIFQTYSMCPGCLFIVTSSFCCFGTEYDHDTLRCATAS